MLRKIPEKRRAHLYRSGSLQSRIEIFRCDKTLRFSDTLTLLTPWRRVLLDNLMAPLLVKTLPTFNGTRMLLTLSTMSCHWFLSWARSIQFTHPHPISWRYFFNIIPIFGVYYRKPNHVTSLVGMCVRCAKIGKIIVGGVTSADAVQSEKYGR